MSLWVPVMCAAKWYLFLRILRVLWKKTILNLYRAADAPDDEVVASIWSTSL